MIKDQDVFSGSLLIIGALAGYFNAAQMENLAVAGLSAAFYPSILFTILLLCGIALIVQGIKRQEKIAFPAFNWARLLLMIAALSVYVILMIYVGFIVSTAFFMLCAMYIFGEKRKKFLFTVPLVTSLFVYYLFSIAFMIVLP